MGDKSQRSWEDAIETLRGAASQLQAAVTGLTAPTTEEREEVARLREDAASLQRSAGALMAKFASELERQRSDIASSIDRQRAEESASTLRASLEELATLAANLATRIAAAAGSGLKQSEPELKSAVRSIEDVAGSAAAWIASTLDATREQRGRTSQPGQPPLDDL